MRVQKLRPMIGPPEGSTNAHTRKFCVVTAFWDAVSSDHLIHVHPVWMKQFPEMCFCVFKIVGGPVCREF